MQEPEPPLTLRQRWEEDGIEGLCEWEVPLGLIAAAFLFVAVAHLLTDVLSTLPAALLSLAFLSLVQAAWVYAGMCLAEFLTKMEFWPMRSAMLKLFSIASLWWALGVMLEWRMPGFGWQWHWVIGGLLELWLLRWMFALDLWQAFWTLVAVGVAQFLMGLFLPV